MQHAEWIAADIESSAMGVSCVGFSSAPDYAICIPSDTLKRQLATSVLLSSETPKIFHNAPYDVAFLRHKAKVPVKGEIHDTLAMAQALHPELPRSLGVITSLYTFQPYYKDTGWAALEAKDLLGFWRYNALDAACTLECANVLRQKLQHNGLWDVYERTREVLPHAIDMSIRGVRYDGAKAASLRKRAEHDAERYQKILDGRAGKAINVNSPVQVAGFLYDDLDLPERYQPGSHRRTTQQKAVLSLYPHIADRRVRQAVRALLRVRHARKFSSSYAGVQPSSDGRMRSSFNPAGTETGRWTASKFLITEGVNLQTVPYQWKSCFVADEGYILWNGDYSQIEARLVSYLANDERSIKIFESGGDIHRENAAVIFQKAPDQITPRERDIGKTVHALNYGVGVDTLMETVNKRALDTGVWITRNLAQHVRSTYLNNFDRVVAWQEETWATVQKERCLTNPFGRRRIFLGPTYGTGSEHTKKESLAFVPQSTVPDLLNRVLILLRLQPPVPGVEVLLNNHDALFGQGPIQGHDQWLASIRTTMQRSISLPPTTRRPARDITIPVDIMSGPRWGKEMKLLPRSTTGQ